MGLWLLEPKLFIEDQVALVELSLIYCIFEAVKYILIVIDIYFIERFIRCKATFNAKMIYIDHWILGGETRCIVH